MKLDKKRYKVFLLIMLSAFTLSAPAQGAMSDYCVTPPFLSQSIPPNVLIVLDNSGSMCDQAYAGSYNPTPFATGQYYGYFDGSKNYRYTGRWEETTDAMTTGTVANPIANGSFLNWATMRRVEVAKRLLTGGKGNPRSPSPGNTVKLDGENLSACGSGWNFQKDFDTSIAGNLIYPFVGNYRFRREGDDLYISPLAGGATSFNTYPIADISVPAGWAVTGATSAWDAVNEASADGDTTYIQNNNTTSPVLLDYNYTQSKPAGVITVTVRVSARRTASGSSRSIRGVLRIGGVDYVSSTSSSLGDSYADYSFTWTTNPQTGAAWDWNEIKSPSGPGSLQAFGVQANAAYISRFPRVTQVYLNVSIATPSGGPYNTIIDMGTVNATGIIDTLTGDVKFGLAFYAGTATDPARDGAKIETDIAFDAPGNMQIKIDGMEPRTWTPLGESLYEMTRYFRQDAPFYSNSPADYSTGLAYDPYWYNFTDASITDRYVPCAKSFILFLTDGESTQDLNIPGTATPYSACTLTNIKACSGFGIPDANGSLAGDQRFAGTTIGTTYSPYGTDYLIDVAYWARTNDMRPGACTTINTVFDQCIPGTQNITLYPVYMFGKGSTLLKDAAIYGGFNDLNANNKPDCATSPKECYKDSNGDGIVSPTAGVCSNSISTVCTSDAICTPGICKFDDPLTYFEGEDGYELKDSILSAIADILKRVTSGTAASVLASGEGSGANLLQATYYPKRMFGIDEVSWIGAMQNLWYYVDPYFSYSNIREEGGTTSEPKDYILNLLADGGSNKKDYILRLYFDATAQKAKAERYTDPAGTGAPVTQLLPPIDFEKLGNLWNAGSLLWSRDLSSSPRKIKTWFDLNSNGVVDTGEYVDFSTTAFNALSSGDKAIMRTTLQAADDAEASRTISYTHGYDKFCTSTTTPCAADSDCVSPATCSGAGYRSRTVPFDLNGDDDFADAGESPKVWKLGDIINSTPQIASWTPANDYDKRYEDLSYADFFNDVGSTLLAASTARYKNRGMVFVGANDGMLHAFKLGKLGLKWKNQLQTQKATLGKYCTASPSTACVINADCPSGDTCTSDTDLGKEVWTFIPKNVLPYLKYMHDPSYCHIYSVDLAPYIVDASIEAPVSDCTASNYWDCPKNVKSWRTILIGGMRFGGACKDTTYTGTAAQGVKVPVAGQGFSSYFALDITDPYDPKLLWEFASPDLGFSTSEVVVARINSRIAVGPSPSTPVDPKTTNGRWFAVFGSGPTGGINTSDKQFLGNSDQNLRLFILDLKTGSLLRTIDTGIANAFAGSMSKTTEDSDLMADYQDDVLYIPYVRKCVSGDTSAICDSAPGNWNNGGVLRLLTNEDRDGNTVSSSGDTALNPANWVVSRVIDDTGPVTSSVVKLLDETTGKLWIYFGTGRYFYKLSTVIDDADKVRHLYGLKDPCYTNNEFTTSCLAGTSVSSMPNELVNVNLTTSGVTDTVDLQGWRISLDGCASLAGTATACSSAYYRTERVITNPLANLTGVVFFTTLTPFDDICSSGGNTAIWAVKHDTGGAPGTLLQGKALIQVSTGAIEQVDLSTAFTEKSGRKTISMQGVPPTSQGLSVMTQPPPVERVIHMRER